MARSVVSRAGDDVGVWLNSAGAIDKQTRNAKARTNRWNKSLVMGF
jgi:hypothetical protein